MEKEKSECFSSTFQDLPYLEEIRFLHANLFRLFLFLCFSFLGYDLAFVHIFITKLSILPNIMLIES